MHLFLEGVCVLHTAVLLKYLIYEEMLFTLDAFYLKSQNCTLKQSQFPCLFMP